MHAGSCSALQRRQRRRLSRHRIGWRIVNLPTRRLAGYAPWWALLETTGRRTGTPRTTPLGRGAVDGDVVWLNSVHGRHADWVRILETTPDVLLMLSARWPQGHATVCEFDEVIVRRFNAYARAGP